MKKLTQISFLFVFTTVLVVIGHSDITIDFKKLWLFKWVYTFHMPLFFFISGFLFVYTNPKDKMDSLNIGRFILKKVKRLLLPYWFISSIIFMVKTLFMRVDLMQHPLAFSFESYFNMLFFHPVGFMWFLPALFVIFLLFIILKHYIFNVYLQLGGVIILLLIAAIIPAISFFQISSAIYYSGYFALGILYCTYKEQIDCIIRKYYWYILPLSFVLSAILISIAQIAALVGILFSISLSLVVENMCGNKIISFSNYTYTIYLLSYFPQMFIRGPIAHSYPDVNQYVFSFISCVLGLLLPVFIGILTVKMKHQNKFISSCALLIGL